MSALLLGWLACASDVGRPQCGEPHVFYAPDGSGDVYFGCSPAEGWLGDAPR
jgi:hypothetical protein